MNRIARILIAVFVTVFLQACARRPPRPSPPSGPVLAKSEDFVDLQAGWKVRVVVPILRSGGYVVPSLRSTTAGNTVTVQTGDDFLGYETAHYKIGSRDGGGIRIRFVRADVWEGGKTRRSETPLLPLFEHALDARSIRLVYLVRVSEADHNMAIVAGNDTRDMADVTRLVTTQAECTHLRTATCTWVPLGVAVIPDKR